MQQRRSRRNSGATLVEVAIAIGVLGIGLSGVLATYSTAMQRVRSGRQTLLASESLAARSEQIREAGWKMITDSAYVAGSILNTAPGAAAVLPQFAEEVIVAEYPPATPPVRPVVVTRSATGAVAVKSSNPKLAEASLLSVRLRGTWLGPKGAAAEMETAFITARNGVKR
jgi:Tfp pilus assembly protein PilV